MTRQPRRSSEERIADALRWLERYAPLIDDRTAFWRALESPPPIDLLVPPGRSEPDHVAALLARRGLGVERIEWAPRHLRVTGHEGAGTLPEVVFGLAFPQGASSSLPPRLLAPRPGERVLDLCAAPGGKTVLISSLASGRARLLAAEPSVPRIGILIQVLARHAVSSALVVRQDGTTFPNAGPFDAIQLDAPCTGEGTFRVAAARYSPSGEQGLARSAAVQRRLLTRGLALLAPGGRLVYSTCAYAPEENEQVISDVLAERDDIEISPLPDDVPGAAGVTRWRGRQFHPDLSRTRRLFPHHTGSWGFFLALLVKSARSDRIAPRRAGRPHTSPCDDPEAREVLSRHLAERFAVGPDALDGVLVVSRGRDVWILSRMPADDHADVDLSRLDVVAPGLRALRQSGQRQRLTTAMLRWLGNSIRERVVDLDWDSAVALLRGDATTQAPAATPAGQIAVRVGGTIVAGGFVRESRLVLEMPKAWR
ncbi:MAG: RsmB/NOP family class I SAM-dependent RNA methyltransferase [Acidobacteriota bacterium]|nr:MAG: RsmB/NOP family class I SAM-dependent RNA methyltransferase [Acidobacteriota bacterium]